MHKYIDSDASMWAAVRAGDDQAFRALFDKYWYRLFKTAVKYLHDEHAGMEIVHDVFINLWDRRHVLVIRSFPEYLLTAVRYSYYNQVRRRKPAVRLLHTTHSEMDSVLPPVENMAIIRYRKDELLRKLEQCLEPLPARCREIFLLSRMQELSNEEIASKLKISKRTVENQISLAVRYLRNNTQLSDFIYLQCMIAVSTCFMH